MKNLFLTLALLLPLALGAKDYPGTKSTWEGCDRYDFKVDGREALVVIQKEGATGNPWGWGPAFFGAFPSVEQSLL